MKMKEVHEGHGKVAHTKRRKKDVQVHLLVGSPKGATQSGTCPAQKRVSVLRNVVHEWSGVRRVSKQKRTIGSRSGDEKIVEALPMH